MAYDSSTSGYSTGGPPPPLPPIGKLDADTARNWFNYQLLYFNPLRRRDMATIRKAELFDQGKQHLSPIGNSYGSVGNFGGWVETIYDPTDPMYIPLVTYNEGLVARQNESARLARPNYKLKVKAKELDGALNCREAARIAQRMADDALRKMRFDHIKDLRAYRDPVHGGYWQKSYWSQTWDKTVRVPVDGAQGCPVEGCGFTTASPGVPAKHMTTASPGGRMQRLAPGAFSLDPSTATWNLQTCPQCASQGMESPLQPLEQTLADVAPGPTDSFGRPLYSDQPLGEWRISLPSPYDMFPRDMGVRLHWGTQAEWSECHIETMDWLALRFPQKAHLVTPENPGALSAFHPLTAVPLTYGYPASSGLSLFRDSCRVKEWHKYPWMEWVGGDPDNHAASAPGRYQFNSGRSIVMAGDVVLYDGPLMLNSLTQPGKQVPSIHMEYVPWEFRDGGERLQGLGLWEVLFDPQVIRNQTVSQTAAVRERCAVPTIIVSKQHQLEIMKNPGIPGRLVAIDPDSDAPSFRPGIMEGSNISIDQGVVLESQTASAAIDKLSGAVEVEKGQVPPGVTAAIAISQLKNYTGERREPRINRMKEADQRCFRHGLELMQALTIEPRETQYLAEDGQEAWAMYQGTDIADQTEIEIEAVPDFEEEAEIRQVVDDQVKTGLLDPAGPKRRLIAKLLHVPDELFDSESRQVDTAQNEWLRFRDSGRLPRVDPMLDDNAMHLEQHGKDLMSGEGQELEEAGAWDDCLKALGFNWEAISNMALMSPPTPGKDLQDTVLSLWNMALMQLVQAGLWTPPQDPQPLQQILGWRAHMEAHRLYEMQKQQQAMMGPLPAAPGGNADAAGNQISPAAPNPQTPSQTITNVGVSGGGPQG